MDVSSQSPEDASPLAYDWITPRAIHFGWGRRASLPQLAERLGPRVFVVLGSRTFEASEAWRAMLSALEGTGVEVRQSFTISHEPLAADVDTCVAQLRSAKISFGDWLLAIGGGSAIDLAKAAGALATQRSQAPTSDYLEGVGRGLTLVEEPLPLVAMPTTGGTGAEATKNAVISSLDPPYKKSLRSDRMVPPTVIVDPELSVTVSKETTAWTGMDAITQLMESYLSRRAKPLAQAMAIEGLKRALPALPAAVQDGTCRWAREGMSHAALLSGMALANSGLGMAHGVAAALGIHAGVAHGLACAVMLPVALRVNRDTSLHDMATLARAIHITDNKQDATAADALIDQVVTLAESLNVPMHLADLGVTASDLPALVKGSRGNSMSGNPRELSDIELQEVLEAIL
jgi:alcohol dehydrogenase class IV